ncbi:23S rRNA (guanosine(2251)-2'-O)-methyltransferase RlmB [Kribbella capetownensis]|uniref:23S rRNA (Guanosine(2251)-2'-O)-methyltransferase RlmB n=1 Tax=Kribbella capetownensis TaxID=1572659 RepID=A0A4R0JPM9_9ACTN|nr:23S rRNA (guanosine(2251)-2'-O)-methyltransferase RlmB [Kribbella capetownensis]TCC43955.1 23S rRNA (guanosine(2251)-2'-O)-methyltransferase RlmB [Kribbella capetownensis]
MPGSSQRKGAIRKKPRGNPTAGSGGRVRRGLEGKGPTPKAVDRTKHPAHKRAKAKERANERERNRRPARKDSDSTVEWVYGRNPVVEALRAGVPAAALHVAEGTERDARLREALLLAVEHGVSVLEVPRAELDRVTAGGAHQGVAVQIPPYEYAHPDDLLDRAYAAGEVPLVVALDGVTDPRNLGAITRSAAAFGAHGVLVPERRAASVSASAWKTSAGAAARIPVARATNLNRALKSYKDAGLMVVGLDMGGAVELPDLDVATEPLVLVVGSEGKGLARLVRENCDLIVSIPMTSATESLNAGIATGVALYEISRRRA